MNCKPGEMATVVRCYVEGCCVAPYEAFGFSVQVDQLIPDAAVPVWRLKHTLKFTLQNPYYSVITHRSFYPGDVMQLFALDDACLQPWRAKPQEKGESDNLKKLLTVKFVVDMSSLDSMIQRVRDIERYDNAALDPLDVFKLQELDDSPIKDWHLKTPLNNFKSLRERLQRDINSGRLVLRKNGPKKS